MVKFKDIVPYMCFYVDAEWNHFWHAVRMCLSVSPSIDRQDLITGIHKLWINDQNTNPVLVSLSVRTAFDLYLRVMDFPRGSEIIVSAINIPDMIKIIHHHDLRIVPLDLDITTMAPNIIQLESLISPNTVALLLAHIYGRRFDLDPFIDICQKHQIHVIEDCAESFTGFTYLGNPLADISLFSFGTIKTQTAFGGAVAKVRDPDVYNRMEQLQKLYPLQKHSQYMLKLAKCSGMFIFMRHQWITQTGMYLLHHLGIDHKPLTVNLMRGFPKQMIQQIRAQPCDSLLNVLHKRLHSFKSSHNYETEAKAHYVLKKIRPFVNTVGEEAQFKNYWLFPIMVNKPEEFTDLLNRLGIDSYKGTTQLDIVKPDRPYPGLKQNNEKDSETSIEPNEKASSRSKGLPAVHSNIADHSPPVDMAQIPQGTYKLRKSLDSLSYLLQTANDKVDKLNTTMEQGEDKKTDVTAPQDIDCKPHRWPVKTKDVNHKTVQHVNYPHQAKYLMDHVVYLPVHKMVPYKDLDKICEAVEMVAVIQKNGDNKLAAFIKSKL